MQIVIWHIFFGYPKSSQLLAKGSARVLRCTTTICPFSWATSFFFFPDEINARWSIWIYLRLPRFFISEFSLSSAAPKSPPYTFVFMKVTNWILTYWSWLILCARFMYGFIKNAREMAPMSSMCGNFSFFFCNNYQLAKNDIPLWTWSIM